MKTISNRIFTLLLTLTLIIGVAPLATAAKPAAAKPAAKPAAKETIDKMVAMLKKAPSAEFVFTIRQDNTSSTGRLVVSGNKFFLTTPEMKIWFDGASQWSYLKSAGEVNLSRPNRDELAQLNPLSILSTLGNNFTYRRLTAPDGMDKIELTPNKPTEDFAKAVVTILTSTSSPKELSVYDRHGNATTVKVTSMKAGNELPISTFRFNPKQFPGVEVVDLR